ncbi:Dual specificity phosphatase, catalytic domain [Carpediemonas membranifera]|uniref:Dual specificity phosphatase, catalytic domain n=1 Tax=Carpediemonas membranifera TaxID=201153 RepID=A0A8J6EBD7_9EUKA|nr:Dual specificity phosphatase, catalytic domain [Carpediemonas membranifera]|eukprot:KAG9396925.1 Dual specificity phosphatase, catalytic domain [Carpediemonas membranifera]
MSGVTGQQVTSQVVQFIANRMMDTIFVGSILAAEDEDFIFSNGVTRVINCAAGQVRNCFEGNGVKYLSFNWPEDDRTVIFDDNDVAMLKIIRFIEESLESDQCLLIHSFDGSSRAVIVFAAYLVFRFHWPPQRALQFVATKRFSCNPRNAFVRQLIEWAGRLRKARGEFRDIFAPNISHLRLCAEEDLHRNTFLNAVYAQPKPAALARKKSSGQRLQWIDTNNKRGTLIRPPTPSYRSFVPAVSDPVEVDFSLAPARVPSPERDAPPRSKTPPPVPVLAARPEGHMGMKPAEEAAQPRTQPVRAGMSSSRPTSASRPSNARPTASTASTDSRQTATRPMSSSMRPPSPSQSRDNLRAPASSAAAASSTQRPTVTVRRRATGSRYRPPTPPRRTGLQKSVAGSSGASGSGSGHELRNEEPSRVTRDPQPQPHSVYAQQRPARSSILSQTARPVLVSSRRDDHQSVRSAVPRMARTNPVIAQHGVRSDRQASAARAGAHHREHSDRVAPVPSSRVASSARPASTGRLPPNRPSSALGAYGRGVGQDSGWSGVRTGANRPASAGRPVRTTPSVPNNLSRSLSVRAASEMQGNSLLAQTLTLTRGSRDSRSRYSPSPTLVRSTSLSSRPLSAGRNMHI